MKIEYNLNVILKDSNLYKSTKEELYQELLNHFNNRNDIITTVVGQESIEMTKGLLLINLMLMRYFVRKDIDLCKEYMFQSDAFTEKNLETYFNMLLDFSKDMPVRDYSEIRHTIMETLNELSDVSSKLNVKYGSTISFHDLLRLYSEDSKAREFFNYELNDMMQFSDIEEEFHRLGSYITDYFKNRKDSELHHYALSETGINEKQLTQALGFVGLKPDINGDVIPVAISDNYFRGLKNIENYYINCKGTRKALITNNNFVRKSGYLTRKISLSMVGRYHDHNLLHSGSKHFVIYNVDSPKKKRNIMRRHYYEIDESGNKICDDIKTVKKDSDIIGKKIGLLSPVTSAGPVVSRLEYGSDLSEILRNVHTGLVGTVLLTNPLTQKLLSAKHLLLTNTDKVEWGESFLDYFSINMNSLFISDNDILIKFNMADVITDDEEEDLPYINKLTLITPDKKTIEYESPVNLFFNNKILKQMLSEDADDVITIDPFDYDEDPVFTFNVKNNELTKSMEQILDLIESSGHLGITTYDGMVNKFNDLLIENGLDIASVHVEMIISELIRDKNTGKRLDFSKEVLDEYEIVRVSKAIMLAPISVALSFERIPEQLINIETYLKDSESMFDYLYR